MHNTRGERNNNPGNVDYHPSNDPWLGLADPPSDGRFCRFTAPEYGLRVIVKLLLAYQKYDGCNTIRKIIDRWAPPNENDTKGYIEAVVEQTGIGADEPMDASAPKVMMVLVKAIVHQENGDQPYSDELIASAMTMAGL